MRIRTDGDYAHREDVIEEAADYYDCNKTRAVLAACEDVPALVEAARTVLERDDLTREQRREMAATLSTRAVSFEVEESVRVEKDS
jgi:hypothetical protein